jgi:hypothetical protein
MNRDVYLTIVFLGDIDVQKAFMVGKEVAEKRRIGFNGLSIYYHQLATPVITQSLVFIINSGEANSVIEETLEKMQLDLKAVRIVMTPIPQTVEAQPTKGQYI